MKKKKKLQLLSDFFRVKKLHPGLSIKCNPKAIKKTCQVFAHVTPSPDNADTYCRTHEHMSKREGVEE